MVGENEDVKAWEKNLLEAIKDISDNDFQNRVWLGKDPKYISSYSEVVSVLYDDFDFERYMEYYLSIRGEEDTIYKHFVEFHQMLEEYKAAETDELILADPKWIQITNKAKEIVSLLV